MASLAQHGDTVLLLSQIIGVRFKKAGMSHGFIQFETGAGAPGSVNTDPNAVVFNGWHNRLLEALKDAVENKLASGQKTAAPSQVEPRSDYDEIERLASLRDKGIITEEEFTAKKRKILGI